MVWQCFILFLQIIFPRLRSLDLSISQVTDKSLLQLPTMRYLQKVDLNSFKEANAGVTSAGEHDYLGYINFSAMSWP